MPLIKIRGNLIREESIIACEGASAAEEDKRTPNEEKHREPRKRVPERTKGCKIAVLKKINPTVRGIKDITTPNTSPANTSPRRREKTDIGVVSSLS